MAYLIFLIGYNSYFFKHTFHHSEILENFSVSLSLYARRFHPFLSKFDNVTLENYYLLMKLTIVIKLERFTVSTDIGLSL